MSENDHLELQETNPEPTTRAELKRLILKCLQTRSREKMFQDLPGEEVSSWEES